MRQLVSKMMFPWCTGACYFMYKSTRPRRLATGHCSEEALALKLLKAEAADSPESYVLEKFYEGYDDAFVLPDEKEPLQGFRDCLALNHKPHYGPLASRYGSFREIVFTASDAASGARVGGGNFIVLSHHCPSAETLPRYRTIHLNYIYVLPGQRRRGYMQEILGMVDDLASDALAQTGGIDSYTFIEQNDPMKMSPEAYDQDTTHAGLDQVARIGLWARRGARLVDVAYAQPPLSTNQKPDDALALYVLRPDLKQLDACIVRDHLRAFFGISVLKGAIDPYVEPTAQGQLGDLDRLCATGQSLAVLDPTAWVAANGATFGLNKNRSVLADGLREHLRATGQTS